ncbi:hypothetical protein GQ600_3243 [Phytophthora cactorum]|nr:hypothetical protein GQ600_3243 [Phytophthora cactorum]
MPYTPIVLALFFDGSQVFLHVSEVLQSLALVVVGCNHLGNNFTQRLAVRLQAFDLLRTSRNPTHVEVSRLQRHQAFEHYQLCTKIGYVKSLLQRRPQSVSRCLDTDKHAFHDIETELLRWSHHVADIKILESSFKLGLAHVVERRSHTLGQDWHRTDKWLVEELSQLDFLDCTQEFIVRDVTALVFVHHIHESLELSVAITCDTHGLQSAAKAFVREFSLFYSAKCKIISDNLSDLPLGLESAKSLVILALVRSKCGSRMEKSSSVSIAPRVSDHITGSTTFAVESVVVPNGIMCKMSLPYNVSGCTIVFAGGVVGVSVDEFVSCFAPELLRKLLPPPVLPGSDGVDSE